MNKTASRPHEKGNVLFYILIAVILLAALSYAVAQSGRGNVGQVNEEKARLLASEILEFASSMSNAVAQLRLRGVLDTELCFDDPQWGGAPYNNPSCTDNAKKIFHLDGGGLTWKNAPSQAMDSTQTPDNLWHIYGNNEIEEVGTTCAAAACAELILVTDELKLEVCKKINDLLGVENPSDAPPIDSSVGTTRFIGTYAFTSTIGDEAGGEQLIRKTGACFENQANGKYTFYKVLVAR